MSTIDTSKEAMKLALEALEDVQYYGWGQTERDYDARTAAIAALREALDASLAEQPAQQDSTCSNGLRAQGKAYPRTCKKCGFGPCVAMANKALDQMAENARELGLDYEPAQQDIQRLSALVRAQQITIDKLEAQRKPLTDEEIEDIWADCPADWDDKINVLTLARAIEAAHGIKEKNT